MATLKDIAKAVGVSVPLVSKVLNGSRGPAGASKKTAAVIRETAARLGYRRNRAALALIQGRQGAIGAILHHMGAAGSGLAEAIIKGIADENGRQDQRQQLAFYQTAEEFRDRLNKMDLSVVDGLIIAGVRHGDIVRDILAARQAGVPIVTVYSDALHPEIPNVGCDNVATGRLAAQHLIDQGCRRIAHVGTSAGRFAGYRQALAEAGFEAGQEWSYGPAQAELVCQGGEDAVAVLHHRGIDFDGLVCDCDVHAMGAMRALQRSGRRAPDDVRVVGVDNSPYCDLVAVPLSSISRELQPRSAQAVRMLADLRDGKSVESVTVAPVLHARESSR